MNEELESLLSEAEDALSDGRLQDAAGILNRAQGEDATDPRIYILGGQLGRRAGNPGAAIMALRRAVRLAPGLVLAHTELAQALELAGRPAEALEAYRQAYALDPDYPEANYSLGIALSQAGEQEESTRPFENALRR